MRIQKKIYVGFVESHMMAAVQLARYQEMIVL